jgi:type IV pilus assembly protein PilC
LASTLEALISAGVGVIEAWQLAAEASGSAAIRQSVRHWLPRVEAGDAPSDHLSRSGVFPDVFSNLYATGEVSGQLDQELKHLHTYYEDSGSRRLERFALVTSLLVTLSVILTVAVWIVRFWMNYYGSLFKSLDL